MIEYLEDFFEEDEDEYDPEREFEREQEELSRCWCGAFQYSERLGRYAQYADCVCGVA